MFKTILFFIVVIAFYAISIWQYINPKKAIHFWFKPAYTEDPKVDEAYVRRSLIIRGYFLHVGINRNNCLDISYIVISTNGCVYQK